MNRAIILAGGKGERLRPFTEDRPKAMIEVLGNPLLTFQLRLLNTHGYKDITICCGYRHEVIVDYFGDGSKHGVKIDYLIESEPLGRGGALRSALEKLDLPPDSVVLAMNGDSVTNLNITDLVEFHNKHKPMASLVTVPLRSPYGIVEVGENAEVKGFREKPELPFWINAGIYALNPAIVNELPKVGDHEVMTFPRLAEQGRLKTFQTRAFWKTIDTVKDLTDTKNEFEQLLLGAFFQTAST